MSEQSQPLAAAGRAQAPLPAELLLRRRRRCRNLQGALLHLANSASRPPNRYAGGARAALAGAQPVADLPRPRAWPVGRARRASDPGAARLSTGPVQLMSGRSQSVLDEVVTAGERQGLKMLPALVKPFRMGVVKELVAGLGLPAAGGHRAALRASRACRRPSMPVGTVHLADFLDLPARALSQSSVDPLVARNPN